MTIQCHVPPDITVWGQADLLKQLVLILAENAIRYTPEGGTVSLSIFTEDEDCVVCVADTGIGIEAQELLLIFERFYRGEEARMKSPEGTGLGLSIAKWIVDQHKGSMKVSSRPGEGSEFQIRLS